jgi:TonB family protein
MRHAIAALAGLSFAVAAARAGAPQEPTTAASPAPSPPAASSPAPADVKVGGKDVPAPRRTRSVLPVYPPEAQALGQRGIVILELVIDESGKVASADVLRSVPPFDDAALLAARQWEYAVTKVDGKPVRVRLTVPITFALRLPDMTRERGIPELRQGALPAFPAGEKGPATVVADVTLHPDGTVAEAAVREGDSPWSETMLQMLRTWRFAADPEAGPLAFEVRAEFVPGPPQRVDLRLSGVRAAERHPPAGSTDTPLAQAEPTPAPVPAPATDPEASTPPVPEPPATVDPSAPSPAASAPSAADPTAALPPSTGPSPPPEAAAPPAPGTPTSGSVATPVAPPPPPEGVRPPLSPGSPTAPPPVEVIPGGVAPGITPTAAATPAPPEIGVSAVRDVTLGPGVPDLTKGRRPVAPPLARMSSVSGAVQVEFSVDASGAPSVQNVSGPELLKEAARQAVTTWSFRRTSPERVYLVAVFSYDGDRAEAEVKRAE